jgi:hypothetical protein
LKLTGGLLICNCGSTSASVHSIPATHVRLQPEAFGLKAPPYHLEHAAQSRQLPDDWQVVQGSREPVDV